MEYRDKMQPRYNTLDCMMMLWWSHLIGIRHFISKFAEADLLSLSEQNGNYISTLQDSFFPPFRGPEKILSVDIRIGYRFFWYNVPIQMKLQCCQDKKKISHTIHVCLTYDSMFLFKPVGHIRDVCMFVQRLVHIFAVLTQRRPSAHSPFMQ